MASHQAAARATAAVAASLAPCESILIRSTGPAAHQALGLRTIDADGSTKAREPVPDAGDDACSFASPGDAAQPLLGHRPRQYLCGRRRPHSHLGSSPAGGFAGPQWTCHHLSNFRVYSTQSSEGSTSSADPHRHLTASERAYWVERTLQKRKSAKYNVTLAARGSGPGWFDHLRKCHLQLAEEELEEQSWFVRSSRDGDASDKATSPPPAESQIAGLCYMRSIEALKARKELLCCAALLEDWLQFQARQPAESKRTSTPMSMKLLHDCVLALSLYTFDATSSTRNDTKVLLETLARLRAASLSAHVRWTVGMYSSAGKAYIRSGMLTEGAVLFSELVKLHWDTMLPLDGDASTDKAAQPNEEWRDEADHFLASMRLMNTLNSQLAARRRRIEAVLSGHTRTDQADGQPSLEALLMDYFAASAHLGHLFDDGFLPLYPMPPKGGSPESAPTHATTAPRSIDRLIMELARVSDLHSQATLLPLSFDPEDRKAIADQEAELRSSMAAYIRSSFDPSDSTGSGKAREKDLPAVKVRQDLSRSAPLSQPALNTLLRYSLRWMEDPDTAQRILDRWVEPAPEAPGAQVTAQQADRVRARLTTLLNEAIRVQNRDFERSVLEALCQHEGVEPPTDVHPDSPRRAILGVQILELLRIATRREAHHTICVLLRCLVAGGYLRTAKAEASPGETSEGAAVSASRPLQLVHAATVVRNVLPYYPRASPRKNFNDVERRLLSNPWVGTNLLNVAAKSGSYNLTLDLWYSIKHVRDSAAAAADQTSWSAMHEDTDAQGMSLVEATCLFGALGSLSHAQMRPKRSRMDNQIEDGLDADPHSNPARAETAVTLMLDIRDHAGTAYDEFTEEWAKLHKPPLIDNRFYDSLLSASGWSTAISVLRGLEEGRAWPRSAEEMNALLRDQAGAEAGRTTSGFFQSARDFLGGTDRESPPPLSAWRPRSDLSAKDQSRARIAFAFIRGQPESALPSADAADLVPAAVAAHQHIEAHPECLSSLLRILFDMRHLGVPIPPAYRYFLARFPALRYDARIRHVLDGADSAADGGGGAMADPRRRRLHDVGLRLAVPHTRGRALSVEQSKEQKRIYRLQEAAEQAAAASTAAALREEAARQPTKSAKKRAKKGRAEGQTIRDAQEGSSLDAEGQDSWQGEEQERWASSDTELGSSEPGPRGGA